MKKNPPEAVNISTFVKIISAEEKNKACHTLKKKSTKKNNNEYFRVSFSPVAIITSKEEEIFSKQILMSIITTFFCWLKVWLIGEGAEDSFGFCSSSYKNPLQITVLGKRNYSALKTGP